MTKFLFGSSSLVPAGKISPFLAWLLWVWSRSAQWATKANKKKMKRFQTNRWTQKWKSVRWKLYCRKINEVQKDPQWGPSQQASLGWASYLAQLNQHCVCLPEVLPHFYSSRPVHSHSSFLPLCPPALAIGRNPSCRHWFLKLDTKSMSEFSLWLPQLLFNTICVNICVPWIWVFTDLKSLSLWV